MRTLFLYFDSGGGHKAVASSIIDEMIRTYPNKFEIYLVEFLDYIGDPFLKFSTKWIYNNFLIYHPLLYSLYYELGNNKKYIELLAAFLNRKNYWDGIKRLFYSYRPQLCITLNAHLAEHIKIVQKEVGMSFKVINVVTDPFTVHNLWASSEADLVITFSEKAKEKMVVLGSPKEKVIVLQYPVRREFLSSYNPIFLRQRFGLPLDNFTLFVSEGGYGIERVRNLLECIKERGEKDLTFIVATGNSKRFYDMVMRYKSDLKGVELFPLSFTPDIALYMGASDVVITKAGPGVIFEALYMQKPVIISSFIPGQEKGNVQFVIEEGVGLVALTTKELIEAVLLLKEERERVEKLKENIKGLKLENGSKALVETIYKFVYGDKLSSKAGLYLDEIRA